MAFNPEVQKPEGGGNYLGYSRGVDPNQSGLILGKTFGGALNDFGAIGAGLTNAADAGVKKSIFNEATKEVDDVRKNFGVDDAATEAKAAAGNPPAPPELQAAKKRLAALQQGYESGAIKDYYYAGQLQNVVKSLKSRFPGYEKEIDATIQGITGITPANTIVAQLQEEAAKKASAANDEAKFERQYYKDNQDDIVRWMPNYFNLPQDKRPSFGEVQAGVANIQAEDSRLKSLNLALEAKNAQHTATVNDQEDAARENVNAIGTGVLQGMANTIGKDQADLQKAIMAAQSNPGQQTPEQTEAMQQLGNKLMLETQQAIDTELLNPRYSLVNGETKNDIRSQAVAPVQHLIDAMNNKDYGTAGATLRLVTATKNQAAYDLMKSSKTLAKVSAAQELLGPALSGLILSSGDKGAKIMNDITTAITADTNADIVNGNSSGIASVIAKAQEQKDLSPSFYRDTVNSAIEAIKNPAVDVKIRSNFSDFLFGKDGNQNFLNSFSSNDRPRIFSSMINGDVAKTMKDLGAQNPAVWDNYRKWAYTNFVDLIRGAAGDVAQIPEGTRGLVNLTFNEQTGQLEAEMNPDKVDELQSNDLAKGLAPGVTMAMVDQALHKYQAINTTLAAIKPLMELDDKNADGSIRKIGDTVRLLFQVNGLPNILPSQDDGKEDMLKDDEKQGSLDMGTQGFVNFVSATEAGSNYDIMAGQTEATHNLTSMTLNEVMDLQKSLPGRPAVGGPQFKLPTLKYLKDEMGLTGDEDFTPELQDKMAAQLMERRGLSAYKAGTMSKEQFANNLAKEWASFPTGSGKSYYQGVGWNKALVDRETLLGEIDKLVE